jgi:protein-S-isoprenylcysteine O-methyltransferase Ste14
VTTPCCVAALVEHVLRFDAPITTTIVLVAVARNFALASKSRSIADRTPSFVGTSSMLAFFVCVYLMIKLKVGVVAISHDHARIGMELIGAALMTAGCVFNVMGRLALGQNWANKATLYEDQTLIHTGVFSVIRHPLYASLIWMSYGSALLYQNAAVVIVTTLVFVPAMYYRAGLEEKLLSARFPDYRAYRESVGMLFPNIAAIRTRKP